MRRNKLVVSTRGPGGGYSLGGSPEQVCIADVINAVDEEMQVADKDIANGSPTYEPCLTEQLWEELSAEIENYLTTISLADMMQNDEVQALSRAHDLRQQRQSLI
jgi:Rrf2 family iron-sulfur cluster assembly transcriptional regulator